MTDRGTFQHLFRHVWWSERRPIGAVLIACLLAACGGSTSEDPTTPEPGTSIEALVETMPVWEEYAPKTQDEELEGTEIVDDTRPADIEEIVDSDGLVRVCTTEKVSFYNTPEDYVMFTPPTDVLYPGALIQGRSLREGEPLLPLNIAQRTPVVVSIDACKIEKNFEEAEQPTLAAINSAVGAILSRAQREGQDCVVPAGIQKIETYRNEEQRALRAGISGRYLNFEGSASGEYAKKKSESSVAALFQESLYTVNIQAPQTPSGWFSRDFTPELLQEQIDRGTIGRDNIPVYVAQVTYGRMFMATMTSESSEEELRLAMEFKFSNPAASAEIDAQDEWKEVRQQSKVTIAYLGGPAEATAGMLRSNDWSAYFGTPATAASARPISFVLKSIVDDAPAVVQELTEYDRVTCFSKVADDATFDFLPKQEFSPGFVSDTAVSQVVRVADVNGDGADDLIWAAASPVAARGQFRVALAKGDGTFEPLVNGNHTGAAGLNGRFHLLAADVDDDGNEDIIINVLGSAAGENNLFVAFYKDGDFIYSRTQNMGGGAGWNTFQPWAAQMDGQRGHDIVWNNVCNNPDPNVCNKNAPGATNRTYIAHAGPTDGIDLETADLFNRTSPIDHPQRNFEAYNATHVADFDGDGLDDIMWQRIDVDLNEYYIGFGTPTGLATGTGVPYFKNFGGSWSRYASLVGDANGDGYADLIEPRQTAVFADFGVYFGQGSDRRGDIIDPHTYTAASLQNDVAIRELVQTGSDQDANAIGPDMHLADVDGNGSQDLIVNDLGKADGLVNRVGVGLSVPGASGFRFARVAQTLDDRTDWSQYRMLVADVAQPDVRRDDLLWISNGSTNVVYVGIARGR